VWRDRWGSPPCPGRDHRGDKLGLDRRPDELAQRLAAERRRLLPALLLARRDPHVDVRAQVRHGPDCDHNGGRRPQRGLELRALGMGRVGMKPHESAAWLYGFLAAVRSGDLYAPPHVVEMVERALERYEHTRGE
jgi:hypothetical protein